MYERPAPGHADLENTKEMPGSAMTCPQICGLFLDSLCPVEGGKEWDVMLSFPYLRVRVSGRRWKLAGDIKRECGKVGSEEFPQNILRKV